MQFIKYNISGQIYSSNQYIKPDPRCNGWIAINRGSGIVFVNGIPLTPSALGAGFAGESVSIGGNVGELWGGDLQIEFAAGTVIPSVVILQKFYL